jgi:hypothetical protein
MTDLDRIWCQQIAVLSKLETDPMQGILFARVGLNISGANKKKRVNLVVPFAHISELRRQNRR